MKPALNVETILLKAQSNAMMVTQPLVTDVMPTAKLKSLLFYLLQESLALMGIKSMVTDVILI